MAQFVMFVTIDDQANVFQKAQALRTSVTLLTKQMESTMAEPSPGAIWEFGVEVHKRLSYVYDLQLTRTS